MNLSAVPSNYTGSETYPDGSIFTYLQGSLIAAFNADLSGYATDPYTGVTTYYGAGGTVINTQQGTPTMTAPASSNKMILYGAVALLLLMMAKD